MKMPSRVFPKIFMKINGVKWGKNLKLHGAPHIFRFSNALIKFGNNCTINSSPLSNLLGLYQKTNIVAKGGAKIIIGDNVGISGATIYSWSGITIGNNSNIGANTKIIDTDFHPVDPTDRLSGDNSKAKTKTITIGENVFIGCNALILKGSVIGDNSVIGAGSVLSGNIPPNCIAAGNPCKIIKELN